MLAKVASRAWRTKRGFVQPSEQNEPWNYNYFSVTSKNAWHVKGWTVKEKYHDTNIFSHPASQTAIYQITARLWVDVVYRDRGRDNCGISLIASGLFIDFLSDFYFLS